MFVSTLSKEGILKEGIQQQSELQQQSTHTTTIANCKRQRTMVDEEYEKEWRAS